MSAFRKFILINRSELDRLRERKIREYNPTVQALARVEKNIEDVLSDPLSSNESKLQALTDLNSKFDHLRPNKNTVKPLAAASIPIIIPNAIAPVAQEEVELDLFAAAPGPAAPEPAAALAAPGPAVALASPGQAAAPEKEFRIPAQYHNKLTELLNIINHSPNIIRAANSGELIINDTLIPHSKYCDAIRELYQHSATNSTIGIALLLNALKSLNVSANLITLVQAIHNPLNLINTPKTLKQKGTGTISHQPPGKRPRVLLLFKK